MTQRQPAFTIGLDYGSDSVRAVLIDARDGTIAAEAVHSYRRWREGLYCDPAQNRFRQHPLDYLEGLEAVVAAVVRRNPDAARHVAGIGVDTTGSTPCFVDAAGQPLALLPEFAENPDAMFVLWKDHTAIAEAAEINRLARTWGGVDYTRYEGGIYSSEWFWAKLLHLLRRNPAMAERAASFVEHCDWLPGLLTGTAAPVQLKRSRCAAGHKAMWHPDWNGLPPEEFLTRLDPRLAGWRDGKLFAETYTADVPAGKLTPEWAARLGLPAGIPVTVGAFDAHMGVVGGEIEPHMLCKVLGTSACDMIVAPPAELGPEPVRGICGQVDGSIVPGLIGLEAGQSAFGDLYAWFRKLMLWPLAEFAPDAREAAEKRLIAELERRAAEVPIGCNGVTALDWMNGRRTPDANPLLKGAFAGLTLSTDTPTLFRALAEASVFGAAMIAERFKAEGVRIDGMIALGGVAKKSPFIMQMTADVFAMPVKVARSTETCAQGAAMFAATAAGLYPDVMAASRRMGTGFERTYHPIPANVKAYAEAFARYRKLAAAIEGGVES